MEENVPVQCRKCGKDKVFYRYIDEENSYRGGFCKHHKEEFNAETEQWNHPVKVPKLCCIPISEHADYIKWEQIMNEGEDALQIGHHVVWWRALGYWHHAIVKSIDRTSRKIEVYEIGPNGVVEATKKENDLWCCCFNSPMYKVCYPRDIESQNTVEWVLMRARSRVELPQCYKFCTDNCEHFAQFCKTGYSQSIQILQCKLTCLTGLSKRLVLTTLRVTLEIIAAEKIEAIKNWSDWVGVLILIVLELLYLCVCGCVMRFNDVRCSRKLGYKVNKCCSPTIRCCFFKIFAQSVVAVALSICFSIPIRNCIQTGEIWTRYQTTLTEIILGIAGALLGNLIGYISFQILPMLCCKTTTNLQVSEGSPLTPDQYIS